MLKYLSLLMAVSCTGCADWTDYSTGKTEIQAFYYHEQGRYTAAIVEHGKVEIVRVPAAIITLDAESDAWYECDYKRDSFHGKTVGACYVHLMSVDDINTAGWSRGKFGRGSTTRIN